MRILKIGAILLFLLLAIGLYFSWPMLKIATAYAAKHACSCVYVQGRDLAEIQDHDLNFSILPFVALDKTTSVMGISANFLGIVSRQAHFEEGKGCSLVYEEVKPIPMVEQTTSSATIDTFYRELSPVPSDAMQAALDFAFRPVAGGGSRGVVVLQNGQLVAERYADPFTAETPLLGWSMTKSITNALVGIAVKQGRVTLAEKNLFAEWQDERSQINLLHLLQMTSGLQWNEAYGNISDVTRMLYLEPAMATFAHNQPLAVPPGTQWVYSSGTTNIINQVLAQTFPGPEAYHNFIQDSLFRAIGMTSALIETDDSGVPVGSSYGWATARDWARLGQLYLQDGMWMGRRILPENWVTLSRRPVEVADGKYGAHIWLKGPDMPNAPDDIFMFRGFQDQRVFIVPSRQCVIVRLGHNDDQVVDFDTLLSMVLAALPDADE